VAPEDVGLAVAGADDVPVAGHRTEIAREVDLVTVEVGIDERAGVKLPGHHPGNRHDKRFRTPCSSAQRSQDQQRTRVNGEGSGRELPRVRLGVLRLLKSLSTLHH
jgi:hypothetical protein